LTLSNAEDDETPRNPQDVIRDSVEFLRGVQLTDMETEILEELCDAHEQLSRSFRHLEKTVIQRRVREAGGA
jgi:hypothetical protein